MRTNWGIGSNLKKMTKAVENWSNNTGNALDYNGEKVSLKVCIALTDIPYKILVKHATSDANKRQKLGGTTGTTNALNTEDKSFMVDA